VLNNSDTDIYKELSSRMNQLFSGELSSVGENKEDEKWERSSDGEADPKWIDKLENVYTVNSNYQKQFNGVKEFLRSGSGQLSLQFSSFELIYAILHELPGSGRSVVVGSPVKNDEFSEVSLLLEHNEKQEDFTAENNQSRKLLDNSINNYVTGIVDTAAADYESEIKEFRKKLQGPRDAMGGLRVLYGVRQQVSEAQQPAEPENEEHRKWMQQLTATYEQHEESLPSEERQKLNSRISDISSSHIESLQDEVRRGALDFVEKHVSDMQAEGFDRQQRAATLQKMKSSFSDNETTPDGPVVDRYVSKVEKVSNASNYLPEDRWESVSSEIVSYLDSELEQLGQQAVDNVSDDLQSKIDNRVSTITNESNLSEAEARYRLHEQVQIAESDHLKKAYARRSALGKLRYEPLRPSTWKYVLTLPLQSTTAFVLMLVLIVGVIGGVTYFATFGDLSTIQGYIDSMLP